MDSMVKPWNDSESDWGMTDVRCQPMDKVGAIP